MPGLASCVAVVLMDVMAIIRIISAARASSDETGARLYQGLQKVCSDLAQYSHFLAAIRPHMTGLTETVSPANVPPTAELSQRPIGLARSMSDPGAEGETERRRTVSETEAERARAATPSPGKTVLDTETGPDTNSAQSEGEEDIGCRLM